jgi:prepilin-type N-terminal cleavage/methylation domain-containing protein
MTGCNKFKPLMSKEAEFMYKGYERGFTIIEVLAIIVILGILTAIALPRFIGVTGDANQNVCDGNVATINAQLERVYHETGYFPGDASSSYADLAAFYADTDYFPDGAPRCPLGGTYTLAGGRVTCDH